MKALQTCKKMMTAAILVALILPINALADDPAQAKPAKVAEVNGKVIAYKDFERQLEIFKQQVMRGQAGQLPEALLERAKAQVVNQMIAEELLYQESAKQDFKLEDDFVNKELKSLTG